MKLVLLFLCTLALSNQASLNSNLRIANGGAVAPFSIPYQIFLWIFPRFGNRDNYACGGVLITPNYVLTSGQCISRTVMATVYAGVDNPFDYRNDNGQFRNFARRVAIIHENFNASTLENNIALIKLEVPLELNERVQLAKLPKEGEDNDFVGQQGRLSGWNNGNSYRPQVLVAINNTVITNEECNAVYRTIRDYEMCLSGAGNARACEDDEGGPLVIGDTVEGIISYRNVLCNTNFPTVVTKIAPFLDWIVANSDYKL